MVALDKTLSRSFLRIIDYKYTLSRLSLVVMLDLNLWIMKLLLD
jgi:hypothetical protein